MVINIHIYIYIYIYVYIYIWSPRSPLPPFQRLTLACNWEGTRRTHLAPKCCETHASSGIVQLNVPHLITNTHMRTKETQKYMECADMHIWRKTNWLRMLYTCRVSVNLWGVQAEGHVNGWASPHALAHFTPLFSLCTYMELTRPLALPHLTNTVEHKSTY